MRDLGEVCYLYFGSCFRWVCCGEVIVMVFWFGLWFGLLIKLFVLCGVNLG